jgi:TRAP-type C4-dicarboxylate transport system substrate-binding protein
MFNEVGQPLHKGALMAAELLKERTDGKYEIQAIPGFILGQGERPQ